MKVCIEMTASEALKAIDKDVMAPLIRCCAGAEEQVTPMEVAPAPIMKTAPAVVETAPAVPTAPVLTPATVPAVPIASTVQEPAPVAQAVPTETHSYTRDDLARAAAGLLDEGRIADLKALLQSFGVDSLVTLPKNQYGAFATQMRSLGAEI